jgi:hypothetical protein
MPELHAQLTMRLLLRAMQKRLRKDAQSGLFAFDTGISRAYAEHYVFPFRRQRSVLLLPDAGVWVGTSEILPTHPPKRVGFVFIRFSRRAAVGSISK